MKRWFLFTLITAACISFATQIHAQPRVGEKMPEFELQATDGKFYGNKSANKRVSIYFFIGHT